jgi:uncharacterized protein (TIGR02145 family)
MYSKDFGKTFSASLKQVSGAVGKGITAGSKEIIWRVLEELPELAGEWIVFRVSISGGEMVHCTGIPTEIVKVRNPITGRIWMDRNLGASRAAKSSSDKAAYGDLYQWGRFGDGHQCRSSATTTNCSKSDTPEHGKFIIPSGNSRNDWRVPQNDNLWQGAQEISNPCPSGFRLPTDAEWQSERKSWNSNSTEGAWKSNLKLPLGGIRNINGSQSDVGSCGYYWSSTFSGAYASFLHFGSTYANLSTFFRGSGISVRCIQD